ncbi:MULTISPECIES: GNAT family N-acetyltransferase [Salinicola]|uniref:GNAT family N-acetyltransferase n=1 Tax=Salinicola socius TaxID=404433 RepID=A0A1Q8SMY2_9GAMM|nr:MULTISPECIES: GNAT family N-acetyltransferase [Salinicola]OLO02787.1 GNAT family N-acetyltransferase [Salinicola socius]
MALRVENIGSLAASQAPLWNAVVGDRYPFLRHEFLAALEACDCANTDTGWEPDHLMVFDGDRAVAVLPRYAKYHSRGEYVFDWSWADAWERAGGDYYPKSLSAIPFTPATGPRLAVVEDVDRRAVIAALAPVIRDTGLQSWHLLFAESGEVDDWQASFDAPLLERQAVQFAWQDDDFGDFEGFLARMSSRKRKEIRRERRKLAEQGFVFERLTGTQIDDRALAQFYRCYCMTYLERGQRPYLTLEFFIRLRDGLTDSLMLVRASVEGRAVAAALCFEGRGCEGQGLEGKGTLYGRYWGSEVEADFLHFETCYYQGIEHCLARGLSRFDPGTQGEHKLTRGFAPVISRSLHYLDHPGFRDAVESFCREERAHVQAYFEQCRSRLPFKDSAS